jgi:hypothetical protein
LPTTKVLSVAVGSSPNRAGGARPSPFADFALLGLDFNFAGFNFAGFDFAGFDFADFAFAGFLVAMLPPG